MAVSSPFPLTHHKQQTTSLSNPTTLRDFLQQTAASTSSTRRFTSFPKTPSSKPLILRAAIAAITTLSFASVKPHTLLPRALSRRLSKNNTRNDQTDTAAVKLKDILRWKSFRDLVDDKSPPPSPDRYTAAATTATTTTTSSSSRSSWCESDFTAEDSPLPSWRDCSGEGETVKEYDRSVEKEYTEATTGTAAHEEDDKKGETLPDSDDNNEATAVATDDDEEEEQHSPVSVLDYTFKYAEEEEDELENRAMRVLSDIKSALPFSESCCEMDQLLLDLFYEELRSQEGEGDELGLRNSEKMRKAEAWMKGEDEDRGREWGRKEAYIREMEREGKWKVLGLGLGHDEIQELGLEIECGILGSLVDELLLDL